MKELYALNISEIWRQFWREHISFKILCAYLMFEYVRPQSTFPVLSLIPFAQLFLIAAFTTWFFSRDRQIVWDSVSTWLIIFFAVILVSSALSYNPSSSFSKLSDYYIWLVTYLVVINIVTTKERFYIFILLFMLASFKISFHGARTWAMRGFEFTNWGLMGPQGYFQNSGELSIQMLIFCSISYYFYLFSRNKVSKSKKVLLGFFPVTAAMTIMGASSRGAQLGLLVQLALAFRKVRVRTIFLLCAFLFIGFSLLPEEQKQRFRDSGSDKTSIQRLLYWEHGIEMMNDHPFFGVGHYQFAPYYDYHFPQDVLYQNAQLPHNILVQVGADLGYVGLLCYLAIIFKAFGCTRRVRRVTENDSFAYMISIGLDLGFVGFLVAGQFVSVVYYPFMWVHLAFVVSLKNIYCAQRKRF